MFFIIGLQQRRICQFCWNHLKSRGDDEKVDLVSFSNVVITHITDGNDIEQEVTSVMGGEIIELESERIMRETAEKTKLEDARVMIECFRSDNVPNDIIRDRLISKLGLTESDADILLINPES